MEGLFGRPAAPYAVPSQRLLRDGLVLRLEPARFKISCLALFHQVRPDICSVCEFEFVFAVIGRQTKHERSRPYDSAKEALRWARARSSANWDTPTRLSLSLSLTSPPAVAELGHGCVLLAPTSRCLDARYRYAARCPEIPD